VTRALDILAWAFCGAILFVILAGVVISMVHDARTNPSGFLLRLAALVAFWAVLRWAVRRIARRPA
jgi:uncharacterized membrane protein